MENKFRHSSPEFNKDFTEYPEENIPEGKISKKTNKISNSEKPATTSVTPELIRHLVRSQFISPELDSGSLSKNISEKAIISEGPEKIHRKPVDENFRGTKEQKQNKVDSADTKINFSNERLLELSSDLIFDGKSIETLIKQKIISYDDLAKILEARKSGLDIEQLFSKFKKSPKSPEILLGQKSVATGATSQTSDFVQKPSNPQSIASNPQPCPPKNQISTVKLKPLSIFDVIMIIIFILIIIFAILSYL